MGTYKRDIEGGTIPAFFSSVLFHQLRPGKKAEMHFVGDKKFPPTGQPITVHYHESIPTNETDPIGKKGPLLFTLRYVAAGYIPGVESVDYVRVNSIEVSGPDITSEVVDKAIAEYQEQYQEVHSS